MGPGRSSEIAGLHAPKQKCTVREHWRVPVARKEKKETQRSAMAAGHGLLTWLEAVMGQGKKAKKNKSFSLLEIRPHGKREKCVVGDFVRTSADDDEKVPFEGFLGRAQLSAFLE